MWSNAFSHGIPPKAQLPTARIRSGGFTGLSMGRWKDMIRIPHRRNLVKSHHFFTPKGLVPCVYLMSPLPFFHTVFPKKHAPHFFQGDSAFAFSLHTHSGFLKHTSFPFPTLLSFWTDGVVGGIGKENKMVSFLFHQHLLSVFSYVPHTFPILYHRRLPSSYY